jgi:hypothetical protein
MDLLEYVAMQIKKGKNPSEIRQILVKNGYPVYEVENALAIAETKGEKKQVKLNLNLGFIKNAPGYVIIFSISGILIAIGIVTLIIYLI